MTRLQEIELRMAEIRAILMRGEGNLDEIEQELQALEQERSAIQRRQEMIARMNGGNGNPFSFNDQGGEGENRTAGADSEEYRDAWALTMMGRSLSEEQRNVFDSVNAEYRAFTHNTENTAVLIPNTVVAGIWSRAAESHPIWDAARKFNVPGTLTMKKHTAIKAGDAAWYDEGTETEDEQNEFAEIILSGCELSKSVTVSWKLKKMAVKDFLAYIEKEIGDRMGAALGKAAYSGKGKPGSGESFKPEPRGIKTALAAQDGTPQVVTYSGDLTDTILRQAMAKVHSSLQSGVVVYANNTTTWTVLAEIKDKNGRPIFKTDDVDKGAVGRMLGLNVKVDDAMANGEVLFGNVPDGFWANINEAMTMHMQDRVKARATDYVGYGIVDADVYDEMAFALVMPGAAAAAEEET